MLKGDDFFFHKHVRIGFFKCLHTNSFKKMDMLTLAIRIRTGLLLQGVQTCRQCTSLIRHRSTGPQWPVLSCYHSGQKYYMLEISRPFFLIKIKDRLHSVNSSCCYQWSRRKFTLSECRWWTNNLILPRVITACAPQANIVLSLLT